MADMLIGSHYNARNYHFNSTDIAYPKGPELHEMRIVQGKKLSKLELLQEDYRSRLLLEKEQKLNALFERKVKADLLPKQGSVREFFINRRLMAESSLKSNPNTVANLPPIKSNSRYNSKLSSRLVNGKRLSKEKKATKAIAESPTQTILNQGKDKKKEDMLVVQETHSKLAKLRERRRSRKSERKFEREDSSETCKSQECTTARLNPLTFSRERSRTLNDRKVAVRQPGHTLQTKEVHKRESKGDNEKETSDVSYGLVNQSSNTENELSKSLAKIKELGRRRTEEFLQRSMTSTKAGNEGKTNSQPSTNRDTQNLEEMRRTEMELRETISRERKRLLVLQQRKREIMGETSRKMNKAKIANQNEKTIRSKTPIFKQFKYDKEENKVERTRKQTLLQDTTRRQTQSRTYSAQPRAEQQGETMTDLTSSVFETELVTCSNCGRGFMKERISKHENACRKASARIKKPFDAKRKRAEGTEMEKYLIIGKRTSDETKSQQKKVNWRIQHEDFIQTIRYAKGQGDKSAPVMTNPSYIECSYCKRKFKPSVAERHIPKCKDIKARPRPPKR